MRKQLEIDSLFLPEQFPVQVEEGYRFLIAFSLGGQNIFVNLLTGYGKSLIFQCLPITADALFKKPRDFSVVISPLRSLVGDQIRHVNNLPELSRTMAYTKGNTVNRLGYI